MKPKFKEMIDKTSHNSCSDFSEQIASFVYGEITDEEKSSLKAHLDNCAPCADEVAGFVFVRSAIKEWRAEDFAKIHPPGIEISSAKSQTSIFSRWFEIIQRNFSLTAIRLSAGLASLLLVACLILYFADFSGDVEFAGNISETNQHVAHSPKLEKNPTDSNAAKTNVGPQETAVAPNSAKPLRRGTVENLNTTVKADQVTTKNQPGGKLKNAVAGNPGKNSHKTPVKTLRKNNAPLFSYEDYEDTSLRLADILEEVSIN